MITSNITKGQDISFEPTYHKAAQYLFVSPVAVNEDGLKKKILNGV